MLHYVFIVDEELSLEILEFDLVVKGIDHPGLHVLEDVLQLRCVYPSLHDEDGLLDVWLAKDLAEAMLHREWSRDLCLLVAFVDPEGATVDDVQFWHL